MDGATLVNLVLPVAAVFAESVRMILTRAADADCCADRRDPVEIALRCAEFLELDLGIGLVRRSGLARPALEPGRGLGLARLRLFRVREIVTRSAVDAFGVDRLDDLLTSERGVLMYPPELLLFLDTTETLEPGREWERTDAGRLQLGSIRISGSALWLRRVGVIARLRFLDWRREELLESLED